MAPVRLIRVAARLEAEVLEVVGEMKHGHADERGAAEPVHERDAGDPGQRVGMPTCGSISGPGLAPLMPGFRSSVPGPSLVSIGRVRAMGTAPAFDRNWRLRVAACNHRAFCSQTSAISARIICE